MICSTSFHYVLSFVHSFRRGSVITDFVIQTSEGSLNAVNEANKNLKEAMKDVAEVTAVVAQYNGKSEQIWFINLSLVIWINSLY